MALLTTTIGAYPKPDFVDLPDWFDTGSGGPDNRDPTASWAAALRAMGSNANDIIARGVQQAVEDQVEAGIDIPTDGEISRENYIHYHCRHLQGIDFSTLTKKVLRNGAYVAKLPTITGPIRPRGHFLARDFEIAQAATDRPVKITMPGPMTIGDTTADAYYDDPVQRGEALAEALNSEIKDLANAGCRHVQIDEPLFARKPDEALDYGIEHIERTFHDCPPSVTRVVHMCCGYPDRLDNPDYPKADHDAYFRLAKAVEASTVQAISLEDAHRYNDLSLLDVFQTTTVIFGCVSIAESRIEPVEEIRDRLVAALDHIASERLIAAPDCGLGLLGRTLARAKLKNLCEAARSVG